ncbi:MAG: ImmA/IrrE family metallo-endopeptidase [Egibacteraceae bacterium]
MNASTNTIIKTVRHMMPARPVTLGEAYLLAEQQATRLLELLDIRHAPVEVARIGDLPKIEIAVEPRWRMDRLAGFSRRWENGRWLITVNKQDTPGRRRFTLAHETKHILDHTIHRIAYAQLGYGDDQKQAKQIESICGHFAACLLMPRLWVKRAWANGIQDVEALAGLFNVSLTAMNVRLFYLGFTTGDDRPIKAYFRRSTRLTVAAI